jgi:phage protein D
MPSASTPIPLYAERQPFYAPAFEIKVRGVHASSKLMRDVMEVTYEDSVEKIDSFTLTVNNWDAENRTLKYVGTNPGGPDAGNADLFLPGNQLLLSLGYQGDIRPIITGLITTVDVEYAESGSSRLTVRGLNVLDRLRRKQYTWSWPDDGSKGIRDSDIAKALAPKANDQTGKPGLDIKVITDDRAAASEPLNPNVFMYNQYPIVFLMGRARKLGYSIFIGQDDSGADYLYFGPSQDLRQVTYALEWGKSLASFHPTFATARQLQSVTVRGWDRKTKKPIEGKATLDDVKSINADLRAVARAANREDVITEEAIQTPQQAKDRAQKILEQRQRELVDATGTTVGLPDLRAGRVLVIRGTGQPFDGQYFVHETTHTINDSGYRTSFKAHREQPEPNGSSA